MEQLQPDAEANGAKIAVNPAKEDLKRSVAGAISRSMEVGVGVRRHQHRSAMMPVDAIIGQKLNFLHPGLRPGTGSERETSLFAGSKIDQ